MQRIPALALVVAFWLAPAAGATPIATVGSAPGESHVSNRWDRGAWMPQVAANAVFRETLPGVDDRSLEAVAKLAATPLSIQVTTLHAGNPQLVFADDDPYLSTDAYVSTETSFIASIP